MGGHETAFAAFFRTGKRAFFVTEKFRFQQRFRQSRAVDGHIGTVAAGAVGVDKPGHHFLARARFAGNKHRGLGRGDGRSQIQHLAHSRALPDDLPGVES